MVQIAKVSYQDFFVGIYSGTDLVKMNPHRCRFYFDPIFILDPIPASQLNAAAFLNKTTLNSPSRCGTQSCVLKFAIVCDLFPL